jgi:hypothetical protein
VRSGENGTDKQGGWQASNALIITANGKRQTANGKRQTANGKRQTANGKPNRVADYGLLVFYPKPESDDL